MNRRHFIHKSTLTGMGLLWAHEAFQTQLSDIHHQVKKYNPNSNDEEFWEMIGMQFTRPSDFIQLEYGYFSPAPNTTLQPYLQQLRSINTRTSYFMRKEMDDARQQIILQLAAFVDAPEGTLTITRNTTESLDTIIHGYPWKPGDEVICTYQDYGSMLEAFGQEEKRHGIKKVMISLPIHPANDEEIIEAFRKAVTPKTRMVLLTHMINLNGHLLPAKKIIDMCHSQGIEVMVDAAHSLAHTHFSIRDLNPDYLGSSLHKWLSCPIGVGLMYIKKEHIPKIWPLFGDTGYPEDDVKKFWHQGTHPPAAWLSIQQAIEFHNSIGTERKLKRLRYLKSIWYDEALTMNNLLPQSPQSPERGGAIANVGHRRMRPTELAEKIYKDNNIFTVAIDNKEVKGIRVTPHLCTLKSDLMQLVAALSKIN